MLKINMIIIFGLLVKIIGIANLRLITGEPQ